MMDLICDVLANSALVIDVSVVEIYRHNSADKFLIRKNNR